MDEFFRDEHSMDDSGWGNGGNGYGGSGGWGGNAGGGGGWGSSGGGGGGNGGDGPGDDPSGRPPKSTAPNLVYLKRSASGYLILDRSGYMFAGSLTCLRVPPLLVYISGDDDHRHSDCVLCRFQNSLRKLSLAPVPKGRNGLSSKGYFQWCTPGEFVLEAKWQAGHYDYSKINNAKFVIYGVSTGWIKLSLSGYIDVATIKITADHQVYVNNIKGSINGNAECLWGP